MIKEVNKTSIFLYMIMILAIGFGVYAQDIAYFLYNNLNISLMIGLGFPTALSIILFFTPPILLYKSNKQMEVRNKGFNIYLGINILAGVIISAFSIIVFIAWLG